MAVYLYQSINRRQPMSEISHSSESELCTRLISIDYIIIVSGIYSYNLPIPIYNFKTKVDQFKIFGQFIDFVILIFYFKKY